MTAKLFWVLAITITAGLIVSFFACSKDSGGGGIADDEGDDTLSNVDDDDMACKSLGENYKCDDWSGDDWTDDTWTDDDTGPGSPILSAGGWDPPTLTWSAECGNPDTTTPCTTLIWSVCDPDNDMLPDGQFFFYQAGTTGAFFVGGPGMNVSNFDFPTTPDFSDCGAPIQFGIGLLITEDQFTSGPGDYSMACDIEATDNVGNLSNKLTNLSLTITYAG